MAFLPDSRAVQVDLSQLSGATVRAWWFDVTTGGASSIGDFPTTGRGTFTPPQGGGSVLVLDDAARGFGTPGGAP